MQPVSFKRHRFPPDVIRLAVWLHFRFTLSFRDVEEMVVKIGAALRLLRKLLKRNGVHPETFTADKLASCRAAFRELRCGDRFLAARRARRLSFLWIRHERRGV